MTAEDRFYLDSTRKVVLLGTGAFLLCGKGQEVPKEFEGQVKALTSENKMAPVPENKSITPEEHTEGVIVKPQAKRRKA